MELSKMEWNIEKMFKQILVHPEDCDLQRILWRCDRADDIKDYQFNTVIYGLTCAPFLVMRTLQQLMIMRIDIHWKPLFYAETST